MYFLLLLLYRNVQESQLRSGTKVIIYESFLPILISNEVLWTVLYGVRYYFFYIPVCYQFFQVLLYSWLAELLVFVFNLHGLLHFTVCSLFPSRIFVTITLFLLLFLINVLSYIMHLLMLKQHCKFRINTTLSCCIMCFSHCHI